MSSVNFCVHYFVFTEAMLFLSAPLSNLNPKKKHTPCPGYAFTSPHSVASFSSTATIILPADKGVQASRFPAFQFQENRAFFRKIGFIFILDWLFFFSRVPKNSFALLPSPPLLLQFRRSAPPHYLASLPTLPVSLYISSFCGLLFSTATMTSSRTKACGVNTPLVSAAHLPCCFSSIGIRTAVITETGNPHHFSPVFTT